MLRKFYRFSRVIFCHYPQYFIFGKWSNCICIVAKFSQLLRMNKLYKISQQLSNYVPHTGIMSIPLQCLSLLLYYDIVFCVQCINQAYCEMYFYRPALTIAGPLFLFVVTPISKGKINCVLCNFISESCDLIGIQRKNINTCAIE